MPQTHFGVGFVNEPAATPEWIWAPVDDILAALE
jgi:hypothetical protein